MGESRQESGKSIFSAIVGFLVLCLIGGSLLAATAIPVTAMTGTTANAVTSIFDDLPTEIDFGEPSEISQIVSEDGDVLARFYAENRIIDTSEQISPYIKNAAVAIEDERFYEHNGLDVQGTLSAAYKTLSEDSLAGGSSITQQYVKNALLEEGRVTGDDTLIAEATAPTLSRKLNEARFAIAVENNMTKDEILTGYLNLAQFGPSQYGVEAASRYYFSVPAADISIAQAAMLAGITQNPGRWDPVRNPEDAKFRRDTVLNKMLELKMITQEEYDTAIATTIDDMLNVSATPNGCAAAGNAAYFCDSVTKQLLQSDILGETYEERVSKLYRGGLTIVSTLDPTMQQTAYDAVVGQTPVDDPSGVEMAMSVVEPGTGKVKALAQNTNYGPVAEDDPDRTTLNLNVGEELGGGIGYQGGSTFKAYTLVQWVKDGHSINDRVNASDQTFSKESWVIPCAPGYAVEYKPENLADSIGALSGRQTVLNIIRTSSNAGAVAMGNQENLCDLGQTATDLGLKRGELAREDSPASNQTRNAQPGNVVVGETLPLDLNPAMLLGSNPVTPLSQANAMATLAAEGKACSAILFTEVRDSDDNVIGTQESECRQVLEPDVAREVTQVLEAVVAPRYTGANAMLDGGRPAAGKTGTAQFDYAAWFMGYTPQLAAAVWQGNMEGNISMFNSVINGRFNAQVGGSMYSASAFKSFMNAALADEPIIEFTEPTNPNRPTVAETPKPRGAESTVPNIVGMSQQQAYDTLLDAGFGYFTTVEESTTQDFGMVTRQSPAAGESAPRGTRIEVVLSTGPGPQAAESAEESAPTEERPADDSNADSSRDNNGIGRDSNNGNRNG